MALKNKYANAGEIPAELKSFYIERDGAWLLDSERNEELRQTNITVMKERDALLKRFEGIDPDAVRQLAAEKGRLEEEQRLKDGKFQEVLDARLKAEREKVFAPVVAERDALNGKLSALLIDQAVVMGEIKTEAGAQAAARINTALASFLETIRAEYKALGKSSK